MSPGVCTAPVPAPERDCPSEGCQLAVRRQPNYKCVERQDVEKQDVTPRFSTLCYSTPCLSTVCFLTPLVFSSRLLIPPPHPRERHLVGPHLIERVAVVQAAILHDRGNLRGVVDVLERIGVEHHEIGELAGLERAEIL